MKQSNLKQLSDLQRYEYITVFRTNYEQILKKDYALKLKIIPFNGGAIIENKIVAKDFGETTKLEKVYSLAQAFKQADLEDFQKKKKIHFISGTSIIVNKDRCYLIKDNSFKEWETSKVNEDINTIMQDIIITPVIT